MEQVLRSFTRRIAGLKEKDYWTRLKTLKMLSIERRSERYKILYIWKILSDLAPNFGLESEESQGRSGRRIRISKYSGDSLKYRTLKENSLKVEGARLFNSLPKVLRNFKGTLASFKLALDDFLEQIPDEPNMGGFLIPRATNASVKPSNSIRDWIKTLRIFNHDIGEELEEVEAEEVIKHDVRIQLGDVPVGSSKSPRVSADIRRTVDGWQIQEKADFV